MSHHPRDHHSQGHDGHDLGLAAAVHEPPRRLAGRVREQFGTAGEALAEQLEALDRQRYGREAVRRPNPAWWRAFANAAAATRPR